MFKFKKLLSLTGILPALSIAIACQNAQTVPTSTSVGLPKIINVETAT